MNTLENAHAVIDYLLHVRNGKQLSPNEITEVEQRYGVSLQLPGEGVVIVVDRPFTFLAFLITNDQVIEVTKSVTNDEPENRWTIPLGMKQSNIGPHPDFDPEVHAGMVTENDISALNSEQPKVERVVEQVVNDLDRLTPEQIRDYEQRFRIDLQSHLLDEGKFCAVYLYSYEFDLEQGKPTSRDGVLEFTVFTDTHMIEASKTFAGFPTTSYQTFPLVMRKAGVESLFASLEKAPPSEPLPENLEVVLNFKDARFVSWHQESAGFYADLELDRGYLHKGTTVELNITSYDDEDEADV